MVGGKSIKDFCSEQHLATSRTRQGVGVCNSEPCMSNCAVNYQFTRKHAAAFAPSQATGSQGLTMLLYCRTAATTSGGMPISCSSPPSAPTNILMLLPMSGAAGKEATLASPQTAKAVQAVMHMGGSQQGAQGMYMWLIVGSWVDTDKVVHRASVRQGFLGPSASYPECLPLRRTWCPSVPMGLELSWGSGDGGGGGRPLSC